MTAPKIGVFGWYMHGNFGDEVMAIMIGRTLKANGYRPVLYRLPPYLAQAEQLETADTIDALTDGAAACILGGGGLLVSGADAMTPSLAVFDDEFRELAVFCTSRSVPVWGVSIGGTGAGRKAKLYPGLARLLGSGVIRGLTLRLQQDKPLVDAFGITARQYPDIVFLAPDFWPARLDDPRHIIATNKIARYWSGRRVMNFLDDYGLRYVGVEPRHVSTRNGALIGEPSSQRVGRAEHHVPYTNVEDHAALFARVRVVISSKLHLGIFGMAYGAVFFSYGGKEKTRAQMQELGLESRILSARDLPGWLQRIRNGLPGELAATATLTAALRTEARGHVTDLLAFLRAATGDGVVAMASPAA
jgi:hypothetical protein